MEWIKVSYVRLAEGYEVYDDDGTSLLPKLEHVRVALSDGFVHIKRGSLIDVRPAAGVLAILYADHDQ